RHEGPEILRSDLLPRYLVTTELINEFSGELPLAGNQFQVARSDHEVGADNNRRQHDEHHRLGDSTKDRREDKAVGAWRLERAAFSQHERAQLGSFRFSRSELTPPGESSRFALNVPDTESGT